MFKPLNNWFGHVQANRYERLKKARKSATRNPRQRRTMRVESLDQRTMFAIDVNDQIVEAFGLGPMTSNRTVSAAVDQATDVDMYSFSVNAGQRIGFDIDRPSGFLDSFLRVFNSAGTQLALNDDGPTPGEGSSTESYIERTFNIGGTYFVGVSGYGNQNYSATAGTGDGFGSIGAYWLTLSVVNVAPPPPSDFDLDDQINQAISLGAMTQTRSRSESISIPTDVDMYSFSVSAGQRIGFDIDRPSGFLDSFLRVFDSAGTQLALNDDGPTPGEVSSTESYIELTFNTSGTYFVGVSGYGNQNYSATAGTGDGFGSTGEYSLTLSLLNGAPPPVPPPPSDTDLDDQINQAIALGAMTQTRSRTGESISIATDVDMYSFSVSAGQRIGFDIDRPSGFLDSFLRVFDAAGTQLALNDDGPTPGELSSTESYIELTFNSSGTYYVGVSGYGNQNYSATAGTGDTNGSIGAYSLTLSVLNVAPPPPPSGSNFQITLTFNGLSAAQQTVFNQAAARWSQIIIGDLPDVQFNGQVIDDVQISASATPIDGVNGILGQAGPTNFRSGSSLPFIGMMQFDTADMSNMEANGTLYEVILHEMGHVLGIGTIWTRLGLLTGAGGANPQFIGRRATAEHNALFGRNDSGVPVENVAGPGSRDSHWRESVYVNELMTPSIGGRGNPISRMTVASLGDLGYSVNMNAADAFTRPSVTSSVTTSSFLAIDRVLSNIDGDRGNRDHAARDRAGRGEHNHEDVDRSPAVVSGAVRSTNRDPVDRLVRVDSTNSRVAESFTAYLRGVDSMMDLLGHDVL